MDIIKSLTKSSVFKDLSEEEILRLCRLSQHKLVRYKKNEIVVDAHEKCTQLFILIEGTAEIQKTLISGKYYNILYLKPGDVFGAGQLFSDSDTFQMDLITSSVCSFLEIGAESVRNVLLTNQQVMYNLMTIMGNMILDLNKRVELFSITAIRRKIAFSLLRAVETYDTSRFTLPISKTQWAEHLNVSRTSLSRELKKLEEEGVFIIEGERINILNSEMLNNLL